MAAWINILRIYRDYEPLKFFGFFGLLYLAIGLLFGFWALSLLMLTGSVGGIPKVLLSVLFISVGFQIILFGFLAEMNKKRCCL